MKEQNEKQAIEEMVEISRHVCEGECFINKDGLIDCDVCRSPHFYDKGYRKQSVGEWQELDICAEDMYCSVCGAIAPVDCEKEEFYKSNFCPNCGARMKGGE